jgi:hypothetical protein
MAACLKLAGKLLKKEEHE